MKVKLTIDIFSGRPNPTVILDDADAKKVLDAIPQTSKFTANNDQTIPEPYNLGYRGVLVEKLDEINDGKPEVIRVTPDRLYSGDSSAKADDTEFEKVVMDYLKKFKGIGNKSFFERVLKEEINRFRDERPLIPVLTQLPIQIVNACACSPDPDLAWWNDIARRQYNNCYNYATNYRTDTFAQPGRGAGLQYTSLSGCVVAAGQRSALQGAVADQLINLPNANNKCPSTGHLVALVIAPGYDFHWYRKGNNGKWSHKPGGTAATTLDNSGNPITDPRNANRGPYTQFCTFMQVIDGHPKLK